MKVSEYIKQHGDFEITEEMKKCIPHKPKSVWDLKEGDTYYWADGCNNVKEETWYDDDGFCKEQRKIGLIALTEEALEEQTKQMDREACEALANVFSKSGQPIDADAVHDLVLSVSILEGYGYKKPEEIHELMYKLNKKVEVFR